MQTEPELKIDRKGNKRWYLNGELHREDGPAIELANGDKEWLVNGRCHREDGPAVEWANGNKAWYLNGERHRTDGPAVVRISDSFFSDKRKEWWVHGRLHREDGPAIVTEDGEQVWCLNNRGYESFDKWLRDTPLTDKEKLKLRLQYAK